MRKWLTRMLYPLVASTVLLCIALPVARITIVPAVVRLARSADVEMPILARWVVQVPTWMVLGFVLCCLAGLIGAQYLIRSLGGRVAVSAGAFVLAAGLVVMHLFGFAVMLAAAWRLP